MVINEGIGGPGGTSTISMFKEPELQIKSGWAQFSSASDLTRCLFPKSTPSLGTQGLSGDWGHWEGPLASPENLVKFQHFSEPVLPAGQIALSPVRSVMGVIWASTANVCQSLTQEGPLRHLSKLSFCC